jgi:threonine aldolase
LGIPNVKVKRAITGALILEVPGSDGAEKANKLAKKMANLFANTPGVRVARPSKRAELRVRNLDDSVTAENITKAVAEIGDCSLSEVRTGDIKMFPNELGGCQG